MIAAATGMDEIIRLKCALREEGQRQNTGEHLLLFRVVAEQRGKEKAVCKENQECGTRERKGFPKGDWKVS